MRRNTLPMAGLLLVTLGVTSMVQAANCTCGGGTRLDETQIAEALSGKVVCAELITNNVTERWQEQHIGSTGGNIIELGNVVGGETVGSWTINGTGDNATVTYTYNGGTSYKYEVCKQGLNIVHFCGAQFGGKNIPGATVGTAKCYNN